MTNTDPIRKGAWIQTFTGRQFWPQDARKNDINIRDIAHSLSMKCRFNGHCRAFYSVAEHSVHVSRIVAPEFALWGLLHDAAESYISDVPRPIKSNLFVLDASAPEGQRLGFFRALEGKLIDVIAGHFRLPVRLEGNITAEVRAADEIMLATEKAFLMAKEPAPWDALPDPLDRSIIKCWTPGVAEREFLARFKELMSGDDVF
ncbi:MAG: phosphohydrolase [Magnetococcales bacterium]|nr:phosphohydrolase [Magnetococcales bacterium]